MENSKGLLVGLAAVVLVAVTALVLVGRGAEHPGQSIVVTTPSGSSQPIVVQSPAQSASQPIVIQSPAQSAAQPIIVQGQSSPMQPLLSGPGAMSSREEQRFGGTTNLDSLSLGVDLTVAGLTTLTGTSSLGMIQIGGGTFGSLSGTVSSTMTNATTTCAIQNTSGRTRTLTDISVMFASTTSVGTIYVAAGTSSAQYVTSTSPLVNANIAAMAGQDVISTTSSVQTAYAPWRPNEWLNYKIGTTTANGTCRASFY